MSDLVERLRIKAGMIEMGEMIAWGSDSALMREAADALELAVPAAQGELLEWVTRLYNTAYHAGHHDTVEGCYTHVYPQDMGSYHEDIVQELMDDNPQLTEQQPAPDAAELVKALERIANMGSMSYHSLESAKITARNALDVLAAYRKQGGVS